MTITEAIRKLNTPISLQPDVLEAILKYEEALDRYRQAREQPSYSVIEVAKIEIADAILKLLDLPLGPHS